MGGGQAGVKINNLNGSISVREGSTKESAFVADSAILRASKMIASLYSWLIMWFCLCLEHDNGAFQPEAVWKEALCF